MRAAIVGCGQIAQIHTAALEALPDVELVAVVDRDRRRAASLAARVPGATAHTDLTEMLATARPDVVHVLTPPLTHAAVAIEAMAAGCHVLVEKPMAVSVQEADEMIAAAATHGVRLSTSHNYLFKPSVRRARELVDSGVIGRVVDVVTYYGIAGEESSLGTGAGSHWAWRLPGGVFTNFLPHLVYLQQHFLGGIERVEGTLVRTDAVDGRQTELVVLTEGRDTTGTMTISARVAPYMKFVEIYGTKGFIRADLVREVCTVQRARAVPGVVAKVAFNADLIAQTAAGTITSTFNVLSGRWKKQPDLRTLVHELYAALAAGEPPPVSGEDGRAVVEAMASIWAATPELSGPSPGAEVAPPVTPTPTEARLSAADALPKRVLVTGANGYLGRHLVGALTRCGVEAVALVRDKSRVPFEVERHARVVVGALDDAAALADAMDGVDAVVHCAAVTNNNVSWREHHETNVDGSRAVVEAASRAGVGRVIHVSSVVVYGVDRRGGDAPVAEDAALPPASNRWAHYQRSKLAAEQEVTRAAEAAQVPLTIVRPGILYGPGKPLKTGLVRLGGTRVSIGRGHNHLPLTYVDNAVDALLLALANDAAAGEAFNVVDEPQRPMRDVLESAGGAGARLLPLPPAALMAVARQMERKREKEASETPPKLSTFVVRSAVRDLRYDTTKARQILGWEPSVPLAEALRRTEGGG